MLAPLAAVLAKTGLPKTPEAGAQRERLKRWFRFSMELRGSIKLRGQGEYESSTRWSVGVDSNAAGATKKHRSDRPKTSVCGQQNRGFCDLADSGSCKADGVGDFGQL